jgi:hypothetical protein
VQLPVELQQQVMTLVQQTKKRSRWPAQHTLQALDISPATYYRWRAALPIDSVRPANGSMYQLLERERHKIVDYALQHPEIRHRELAWRMVDEGVCAVSAASVYRVLRSAQLVCRWKPKRKAKGSGKPDKPIRPDERWETDIRYTKVNG